MLVLLLLGASGSGVVALWQANRADKQSKLAQSRELVAQANSLVTVIPNRMSMLLVATAYKISSTVESIASLTRMASQWRHADRLLATGMRGVYQIAFNPTDPTMVALTNSSGIELWDIAKNIRRGRHVAVSGIHGSGLQSGRRHHFLHAGRLHAGHLASEKISSVVSFTGPGGAGNSTKSRRKIPFRTDLQSGR
ncbi:MAG: hypothetical protein ACRDQY_03945 [Pseudonocardiaceae bacterium]